MNVAETVGKMRTVPDLSPKALYLLAAPSTPELYSYSTAPHRDGGTRQHDASRTYARQSVGACFVWLCARPGRWCVIGSGHLHPRTSCALAELSVLHSGERNVDFAAKAGRFKSETCLTRQLSG
jgi:hypothetical protein